MVKNKVACVALTGGEPLLADNFWYIVEKLFESNIHVEVATNGTLLDEEKVEKLVEFNILNYQISLEGITEESNDFIRGKGSFDKIIKAIQLLKQYDVSITVACTLTHKNYHEIENFIRFKENNAIDCIRFEMYIPVRTDKYKLALSKKEISYITEKARFYLKRRDIIFPEFINYTCGAGETMLLVNSDLSVSPCDLLCDEIRSKNKISQKNTLIDIVNNDDMFIWWRNQKFRGCGASIIKNRTDKDIFEEIYLDE